jgi:hypothetical protein
MSRSISGRTLLGDTLTFYGHVVVEGDAATLSIGLATLFEDMIIEPTTVSYFLASLPSPLTDYTMVDIGTIGPFQGW